MFQLANFNKWGGGRSSNIELLRIVSMSMIVIHHFLLNAITPAAIPNNLFAVLDSFVYAGVNVFFLISGCFLIKLSFRSIVKFAVTIFYFCVINIILSLITGIPVGKSIYLKTLFYPISGGQYWFIQVYFMLMLTAPLINAGIKSFTKEQLRNLLILFSAGILYSCAISSLASYSYLQGLYLYVLGYYLYTYRPFSRVSAGMFLLIFIICCLLSGLGGYMTSDVYFGRYNNVFMIVGAVSLLLCFERFDFHSSIVNAISGAALGCYLLQDGYYGSMYFYMWQSDYVGTHGLGFGTIMMFTVSFLSIWALSFVLTAFKNVFLISLSDGIIRSISRVLSRIGASRYHLSD